MSDDAPEAIVNRPGVFTLAIRSKSSLYAAWIPILNGGGIFMPNNRVHVLGDEVLILLSLPDDPNKIAVHSIVAWINPAHATGNRPQGIGVRLGENGAGRELKKRVEGLLTGAMQSVRPTHTL